MAASLAQFVNQNGSLKGSKSNSHNFQQTMVNVCRFRGREPNACTQEWHTQLKWQQWWGRQAEGWRELGKQQNQSLGMALSQEHIPSKLLSTQKVSTKIKDLTHFCLIHATEWPQLFVALTHAFLGAWKTPTHGVQRMRMKYAQSNQMFYTDIFPHPQYNSLPVPCVGGGTWENDI